MGKFQRHDHELIALKWLENFGEMANILLEKLHDKILEIESIIAIFGMSIFFIVFTKRGETHKFKH